MEEFSCKCGLCGKPFNRKPFVYTDGNGEKYNLEPRLCIKCEREINQAVLGSVNKIVARHIKHTEKQVKRTIKSPPKPRPASMN